MTDKPVQTIRIGAVKVSIWENQAADGRTFHTTSVAHCYKADNDQWKESSSFLPDELPKLELALRKAFEFIHFGIPDKQEAKSFRDKVKRRRGAHTEDTAQSK